MLKVLQFSALFLLALYVSMTLNVCIEYSINESTHESLIAVEQSVVEQKRNTEILFVGDIMLGRATESFMETNGTSSPFMYVGEVLSTPDISIANFEGVVTEEHEHTPDMTFRFSVKDAYVDELKKQGIDMLSLANNHALDYGATTFDYMKTRCDAYGILCGGSPHNLDNQMTHVLERNGVRIGILFLHTLYGEVSTTTYSDALDELKNESDVQVAYIHWGEEYSLTHSRAQEELAHDLIERGVDAVVGHHPHVVQDIELYGGKPIFYSLGNFIFDQYFDTNVQEMIALHILVSETELSYRITPLTTVHSRLQPQEMSDGERGMLFDRIFAPLTSTSSIDSNIGVITTPR